MAGNRGESKEICSKEAESFLREKMLSLHDHVHDHVDYGEEKKKELCIIVFRDNSG